MPKVVGIKLTDQEYAVWEENATKSGLSVVKWARRLIEQNMDQKAAEPQKEPEIQKVNHPKPPVSKKGGKPAEKVNPAPKPPLPPSVKTKAEGPIRYITLADKRKQGVGLASGVEQEKKGCGSANVLRRQCEKCVDYRKALYG